MPQWPPEASARFRRPPPSGHARPEVALFYRLEASEMRRSDIYPAPRSLHP